MFKAAWFSCVLKDSNPVGVSVAAALGARVFFSLGDNPYVNTGSDLYGFNSVVVDKDSTQADFQLHHDQHHNQKSIRDIIGDYYMMADDHEWGGDNWDHTITQANAQTGIGAVTQADVDTHWDRGNKAYIATVAAYADNPANTDATAIAEAPSNAAAAATNYPVRYFRVGYDVSGSIDNAQPHVEFFVLDCISYRDPIADVDGGTVASPSKTMLGANQRTWLKTQLSASTATFKVIASTKKTYIQASGDNGDNFGAYANERDHILDYIDSNSITGVLWITGDKHVPQVISKKKPGDTYDVADVCACPIGVITNTWAAGAGIIWHVEDMQVVGLLSVYDDYIEPEIIRASDGASLWRGRINSGNNYLSEIPLLTTF